MRRGISANTSRNSTSKFQWSKWASCQMGCELIRKGMSKSRIHRKFITRCTCCLASSTSANCLPADTVLLVHTLQGLSITEDAERSVAGHAIAAIIPNTKFKIYHHLNKQIILLSRPVVVHGHFLYNNFCTVKLNTNIF